MVQILWTKLAAQILVWSQLLLLEFAGGNFADSYTVNKVIYPIRSQCTISLPPENIRKLYGFLMFSGVEKGRTGNNWVKITALLDAIYSAAGFRKDSGIL